MDQKFEWYNVGRGANYAAGTGADNDGTLAILQNNPVKDIYVPGQDIANNIAVKIGYDDGNLICIMSKWSIKVVPIVLTLTTGVDMLGGGSSNKYLKAQRKNACYGWCW